MMKCFCSAHSMSVSIIPRATFSREWSYTTVVDVVDMAEEGIYGHVILLAQNE